MRDYRISLSVGHLIDIECWVPLRKARESSCWDDMHVQMGKLRLRTGLRQDLAESGRGPGVLLPASVPACPLWVCCAPALDPDMKRTMCGRGGEGDSSLHHSFWASLCQGTQPKFLGICCLGYALGGTELSKGMFIMVSKCLAAAASPAGRQEALGAGRPAPTSLSPTSISGVRDTPRDLGRGVCFSGQQAKGHERGDE